MDKTTVMQIVLYVIFYVVTFVATILHNRMMHSNLNSKFNSKIDLLPDVKFVKDTAHREFNINKKSGEFISQHELTWMMTIYTEMRNQAKKHNAITKEEELAFIKDYFPKLIDTLKHSKEYKDDPILRDINLNLVKSFVINMSGVLINAVPEITETVNKVADVVDDDVNSSDGVICEILKGAETASKMVESIDPSLIKTIESLTL